MENILYFYIFYWIASLIGFTIGFHRVVTHRTIKLHPVFETLVIYVGVIASLLSPLSWAGMHRMHHAYSDTEKDPHSPKYMKWYQILFSTYRVKTIPRKFVRDLYKNPRVMFFHKYKLYVVGFTYYIAFIINPAYLIWLLLLLPTSFIFFGLINITGHDHDGNPVNRWWINLFAPFEGNHHEHHKPR